MVLGTVLHLHFSEVSLCEVSVFIFSRERLRDSGYLFQSKTVSLSGTGMVREKQNMHKYKWSRSW